MKMSGIDKTLSKQEDRAQERKLLEQKRREKEVNRKSVEQSSQAVLKHSSDSEEGDIGSDQESDYEFEIPVYYMKQVVGEVGESSSIESKKPKLLEKMLNSPDVSSTLDRINISDRKFVLLAAAIVKANDEDLGSAPLSHSTVHRKRSAHRSTIATNVKQEFLSSEKSAFIVHWDGKIMKNTTNQEDPKSMVDRLAVSVTGHETEKILGMVKIPAGTGQAQASATFQLLKLWEVTGDVVGMSFDTTSSNTGPTNGACVLLEQKLQRNLLYFACRHHIHELIIGGVFTALFGPSRSPNIPLFERFQQFWPNVVQQEFQPLNNSRQTDPLLQQLSTEVTSFLNDILSTGSSYMPREDYAEMIELCLLVLGKTVNNEPYQFRRPGAYHLARWMAKVIYCFKIYLFRDQFKLTAAENRQLEEFCLFASHIYVKAWISCPIARDAPVNDMLLIKQIHQYSTINKTVSDIAMKKLENHLWYLGAELLPLCLFSDKISVEEKRQIVTAM